MAQTRVVETLANDGESTRGPARATRADGGAAKATAGQVPQDRGRSLWLLAGVPFLMVLGNSMLFPIFPKMQQAIGISEMQTSLIVTAFSIPAGILIPVAGYLSDRFGRRVIMAPGVALFGVGALMAALASTVLPHPYTGILVGRVVQGMGAAGMSQLAMAMVADLFGGKSRARALGTIEAANGLGKVVSPISGGLVGLISWYLPFYIFAVLSLPLALGIFFYTREPRRVGAKVALGRYVRRIADVFGQRGAALGSGLVAGGVTMFLLFGTLFFLSETLERRFHVPELLTGFILAIPVAAMSGVSYLVGTYLSTREPLARAAVIAGLGVLVAVEATLALLHAHRPVLYVATAFVGVGAGVALPALTLLITSSADAAERGLITSLYGAVRFFGVALGPPAFGFMMKASEGLLFGLGGVLAGAALVVALIWLSSRQLLGSGGAGQGGDGDGHGPTPTARRRSDLSRRRASPAGGIRTR